MSIRSINMADGHSATETKTIDQEVVLAVNTQGKPEYVGRANAGAISTDKCWQIYKNLYDTVTGNYIGYVFANSDNGFVHQASAYSTYTYTSPIAGTLGSGNNYTVTLTTGTTSTAAVFRPSDGYYLIAINGTWTGAVSLERYHATLQASWQVVNTFTQNIQTIGTHAGGSGWQYRFEFTTATSGSPTCIMAQS